MIYDFKNIERVYFVGDVHGRFQQFKNNVFVTHNTNERHLKLKKNEPTLWVACGDIGFGFNKDGYYTQIFDEFNEFCSKRNINIILIRGNHDDPSYFNDEKINYSNIKAVSDYSVLQTKSLTILCVGGGLSIDRTWRKSEEIKRNRYSKSKRYKYYWEDEMPIFSKEKLDGLKEQGIIVDAIASHTAPSFCYPLAKEASFSWFRVDNKLRDDLNTERGTMDSISNWFKDNKQPIKIWVYGHFHQSHFEIIEHCFYLALNECECRNSNECLKMLMSYNQDNVITEPKQMYPCDGEELNINPTVGLDMETGGPTMEELPRIHYNDENVRRMQEEIREHIDALMQPFNVN